MEVPLPLILIDRLSLFLTRPGNMLDDLSTTESLSRMTIPLPNTRVFRPLPPQLHRTSPASLVPLPEAASMLAGRIRCYEQDDPLEIPSIPPGTTRIKYPLVLVSRRARVEFLGLSEIILRLQIPGDLEDSSGLRIVKPGPAVLRADELPRSTKWVFAFSRVTPADI